MYYQANLAYPLLPELQSLFVKTVGLADKIREALEPFLSEIDQAFIFGSVARGERTAHSDVDVLVVGSLSMADLALPLRELERTLQIPVNVIHFTAAEFQEKQRQNNHFLQAALRGKKIFLKWAEHELADIADESTNQSTHNEQARVG